MKIEMFDGCIGFGINLDHVRVKSDDMDAKKALLFQMIEHIEDIEDINDVIRDVSRYIEAHYVEANSCHICGAYNEFLEYEID